MDSADTLTDQELVEGIRQGDHQAFATLAERHGPWLQRLLYRLTWDEEEAKDGAQETLMRFWLARKRFDGRGNVANYLYTVAGNWLKNRRRSSRSRPRVVPLQHQLGQEGRALLERMIHSAEPAEATVLRRYQHHMVRRAVARLPEPHRTVLILGHLEGVPYPRIAEILAIPVGTVKSRMYHAVDKLRHLLEQKEVLSHEM